LELQPSRRRRRRAIAYGGDVAASKDPRGWTPTVGLERARLADRAGAAAMRVALEWHTAEEPASAERWLALAWACLHEGDPAAAATAARAAAGRAIADAALGAEIGVVLDRAAGVDRYQGPGIIRRWPGGRFVVELPGEPIPRWAEFHWGHAIGAGVTPADGATVDVSARIQPARGWRVQAFAPTGEVVRAALTRDGAAVRCGALAYLRLREPCPPPLQRWSSRGWRSAVGALPIGFVDSAIDVRWAELGVASWEELAAAHPPPAAAPAPPAAPRTDGKLTRAGQHLIVDGKPRPLAAVDCWPAGLARPQGDRWRRIVAAVPFVAQDDALGVDWPRLAAMHELPPAVAAWPDVVAACAAPPAAAEPLAYTGPGQCEYRRKRLFARFPPPPRPASEGKRRLRNTARHFPQNHVALLRPEMRGRIVHRDALAAAMRLDELAGRPTGDVAQLYSIRKSGKSTFLVSHLDRGGHPYAYLNAEYARLHEHAEAALADPHPARVLVEGARRAAAEHPAIARMLPVSTGGGDDVRAGAVLIVDEIEAAAYHLRDRLGELLQRLVADHPLVVVGLDPWWPARFLSMRQQVPFAPPWRFELFDAGELVEYGKALLDHQVEVAPGLAGWLLAQTGGHPTVARHVVSSLLDWAIAEGRAHRGDTLEAALAEEWWSWRAARQSSVKGLFGTYLATQADRLWARSPEEPYLAMIGTLLRAVVLRADAAGTAAVDEVLAACAAAYPEQSAAALLDAAVATSFVDRDGERVRLTIPLLHRYVTELGPGAP
jgi:hypothetical protein